MKNNNEIHLLDLADNLKNTLVKLDLQFLRRLLKDTSKCERPWRNKKFVEHIGYTFNKKEKFSPALQVVFREGRAIKLEVIRKMLVLSSLAFRDVEKSITSIRAGRNRGDVKINFPIIIDRELGSIIGHILGDGSIEKCYSQPFFSNKNKELLKEFDSNIKKVFGINGRIWIRDSGFVNKSRWLKRIKSIEDIPANKSAGLFYPSTVGIILHTIFGKFAKGKNKEITNQILNSNMNFKKSLIRAFFDDEGSIQSSSHTIRFFQDNKKLLEKIKIILKEFDINTNPIRFYYKRNKIRYQLNLTGYKNYYKFYHLIGCTSSKKKKEFELLINKVKNSRSFKKKFAL